MSTEDENIESTLEPGVDLEKVDFEALDRGDEGADPSAEEVAEQARDDKGRFAEKEPKIPKSRFDEQVSKEREAREAAERRAAEAEQQLAARQAQEAQASQLGAVEEQLDALEDQYQELLLDGNSEEAAAVRKEIRTLERKLARHEAEQYAAQGASQVLEGERFSAAVARLEADYPALNPNSDHFDQDLCDLVLTRQRSLMQRDNLSPSQALVAAANHVVERFLTGGATSPQKGLSKAQEDRRAAQVQKNLDTMARQPASLKSSGMDSDKLGQNGLPDVTHMSYEEFSALPESTLSRLRGDNLV